MIKFIKKHKKAVFISVALLGTLIALATWQRSMILQNSTESKLPNPPRNKESYQDTFYYDQLTDKEKAAYDVLKDALEGFSGGEIVFQEPLNGKEYTRVCNALEYGQEDYFYGMINIPMTQDGRNITYEEKNALEIKEDIIAKCMLFLSCAEGIDQSGIYNDEGYVINLEDIKGPLAAVSDAKVKEIEDKNEKIDQILNKVIGEMPEEYGTKEAVDYFLKWMEDNLEFDKEALYSTSEIGSMSQLFEQIYAKSHLSSVLVNKALAGGYAKVLANLCNRAGVEAHMVIGEWESKDAYILTCIKIGDENIYVDAAGQYKGKLGNQQYLNEKEAWKHMKPVDYFEYGREQ